MFDSISRGGRYLRLPKSGRVLSSLLGLALVVCGATAARAESCTIAKDMDAATRTALLSTGGKYFDLVVKGDAASLKQRAIPSLAGDSAGIEGAVKENQAALAGTQGTARPPFLLEADSTAVIPQAEFLCGVFGANGQTSDSAIFRLESLPPGKYAVVLVDAAGGKSPYTVSFILQQIGSDWKLGGLYIKPAQSGGHDMHWFVERADEFKAKGQTYAAWLYYLEARSLASPLPFMSTAATDKLYDDSQKAQPPDFPGDGKTFNLVAGATSYKVTAMYPVEVGGDLDLVVKYDSTDVTNTNAAYASNVAVMKALLTKYPELRGPFAGIEARAVEASGRDYGTLLAMKDVK